MAKLISILLIMVTWLFVCLFSKYLQYVYLIIAAITFVGFIVAVSFADERGEYDSKENKQLQ